MNVSAAGAGGVSFRQRKVTEALIRAIKWIDSGLSKEKEELRSKTGRVSWLPTYTNLHAQSHCGSLNIEDLSFFRLLNDCLFDKLIIKSYNYMGDFWNVKNRSKQLSIALRNL